MGFNISGSETSQDSSSQQESGVSRENRDRATAETFRVLSQAEPFIAQFMQNPSMLNLNSDGLTPGAASLAGDLVSNQAKQFFSKLSGTGALRGQVNPANTSSIIGSATERAVASALPQFIDQARANEFFNATSKQNTQGQGLEFLAGLASLYKQLTQGSAASSEGSGRGFSFGVGVSGGSGGGGGTTTA